MLTACMAFEALAPSLRELFTIVTTASSTRYVASEHIDV